MPILGGMQDIKLKGARVVAVESSHALEVGGCGLVYITLAVLADVTRNEWRALRAGLNYEATFSVPEPKPVWGSCVSRPEQCKGASK